MDACKKQPQSEKMKKFLKRFVNILLLTFVLACSSCNHSAAYVKIANKITDRIGKKLQKEKGLVLIGKGGKMTNDIQLMRMAFYFYPPMPIKAARSLLLYSIKEYLLAINENKKIQSYLHVYPFTAENVEIVIYFYNRNGAFTLAEELDLAIAKNGRFTYFIKDPKTKNCKEMYVETFEEALQIGHN